VSEERLLGLLKRGVTPGLHITQRLKYSKEKISLFDKLIQAVLSQEGQLFPMINGMGLRGRKSEMDQAGVHANRIIQPLANTGKSIKVSPSQLGHGHQSTLAWIAELIGYYIDQDPSPPKARGKKHEHYIKYLQTFEGVVLIDELDETLHPQWQLSLIPSLKALFPKLQFVVTTHSPLLLARLQPDEIIRLDLNDEGLVYKMEQDTNPGPLASNELYREFFGVTRTIPKKLAEHLDDYRFYARRADRTEDREKIVQRAHKELTSHGIGVPFEPIPRKA
jgi:hypothetical protein